jgi:hypothetical protein
MPQPASRWTHVPAAVPRIQKVLRQGLTMATNSDYKVKQAAEAIKAADALLITA